MNHWNAPAILDRLEEVRGRARELDVLARDLTSRCLRLGPGLEFPVEDGHLVTEPFDGTMLPGDLLLGRMDGTIWWARDDGVVGADLRSLDLSPGHTQVAMMATALFEWHRSRPACLTCGGATAPDRAGTARRCLECGHQLFPRTDPAIILAITDPQDRLLLTHSRHWPGNRVSVQAGFIEAGESAEQACHREVREETGLSIRDLRFVGTQPWPFPRSLMLGFEARSDGTEPQLDEEELAWGSFHSRDELNRALERKEVTLPGHISLARQLIEDWRGRGR